LPEDDKFSGLEGSMMLMMPSFYESLSMVTLEAWALGKPVLANGQCDVLRGQCVRSHAGLYYENYGEFKEAFRLLLDSGRLRGVMGKNGERYFKTRYTWDVIESKYLALFDRLAGER